MSAFNISKEASICTALEINGYEHSALEYFFSGVNQPDMNAIDLASKYLGLPNYAQMIDVYNRHLGIAA